MATIDAFVLSIDRAAPPPFATTMLRAVWHGLPPRRDATRDEGLEIATALIRSIEGG